MKDFTIVSVLYLPRPWPPRGEQVVLQQRDGKVDFQISFSPFGQVRATARAVNTPPMMALSPTIKVTGCGIAQMMLSFVATADQIELCLNGGPPASPYDPPINLHFEVQHLKHAETIDAAGIKAALQQRAKKQACYVRDGLTQAQMLRRWNDLAVECRLLRSALKRLHAGEMDEVRTISNQLRKLIGNGKGNHVLQDCAGFTGSELTVWIEPPADPALWTPAHLKTALTLWEKQIFSPKPHDLNSHKTDLDFWLSQSSGIVGSNDLKNLDKLHAIANKIGSHADLKDRETIEILDSLEYFGISALARYLHSIGTGVLEIADAIQLNHK